MTLNIIIALLSLLLAFVCFVIGYKRYADKEGASISNILRCSKTYLALTGFFLVGLLTAILVYGSNYDIDSLIAIGKWVFLFWGCYLISYIDIKERKIPNKIIAGLLLIRVALLIYEVLSNLEYLNIALGYPLIGAAIGSIIMVVAMLISRKGVGMGDVKLFLTIGFFVGSTEIIATLFYTFLYSAIVGIFMLITRKAKLKDTMPMAPFAFAGVVTSFLLLMIGG